MKARLLKNEMGDQPLPAGTVVSGQDAFVLVEIGKAKPADAECLAAVEQRGKVKPESYLLADLELVADEPHEDTIAAVTAPAPAPAPEVVIEDETYESGQVETSGDDRASGEDPARFG